MSAHPVRALRHPALLIAGGALAVVGAAVALPAATVPVLGLVAVLAALPVLRSLADGAAWALPVLIGIAVLLADTGGRTLAPGPERYAVTAVVVLVILLVGVRSDRRSRGLRATALVLFAYGLVGTLYGRFVLGTINGTLPLIGPMVIACLPPMRSWGRDLRWRTGLRWLSAATAAFAVFSGLARMGVLPAQQIDVVNHEKAFLVVLAVGAAMAARDRLLLLLSLAAAVFAFSAYPAATYVVAALAMVGTLVLVRWAPDTPQRVVFAVLTMVGTVVAVLHIDDLIRLTTSYFRVVGKQDNGDTRAALYHAALERLDSPVFSSFFTGDITVVGNLSGRNTVVPVHNDYLSISLGGGFVAAALLLGLFLFANGLALRALRAATDPWRRRTITVLLGAVNAAAVSAFANPIFMNPGASAVTYALVAALMAACREREPVSETGPPSTPAAAPPARS